MFYFGAGRANKGKSSSFAGGSFWKIFKNSFSIISIILEGSLMLERIRSTILRRRKINLKDFEIFGQLHFLNKRWSIVQIAWAIKTPRVSHAKTSMELNPPLSSSPWMMGSTWIFGSMSGWKLIVGPIQVHGGHCTWTPDISSLEIVWKFWGVFSVWIWIGGGFGPGVKWCLALKYKLLKSLLFIWKNILNSHFEMNHCRRKFEKDLEGMLLFFKSWCMRKSNVLGTSKSFWI